MPKNLINVAERSKTLSQRVESQQERCQSLSAEAHVLATDRTSKDRMERGLFVLDLIVEAQAKLVECQLVAGASNNLGERATVQLAITERWVTSAIDLLNRAQLVLDDQQDIWGKPLPTGGLWDK